MLKEQPHLSRGESILEGASHAIGVIDCAVGVSGVSYHIVEALSAAACMLSTSASVSHSMLSCKLATLKQFRHAQGLKPMPGLQLQLCQYLHLFKPS